MTGSASCQSQSALGFANAENAWQGFRIGESRPTPVNYSRAAQLRG
jgi:hypothetical protein